MKLALVGCGAIAESFHLPALRILSTEFTEVVLVDPEPGRAEALAGGVRGWTSATNHREVLERVDGAVICTPHHLHAPIATDFLQAGRGVLVEKPLGVSVAEVEELDRMSRDGGAPVLVNQTRRYIPTCREIARWVHGGRIGTLQKVDLAEGDRFGWPAATPAMFGRRAGGRGVLLDIGVHALDLATWWFGDALELDTCETDGFGGSEASALARFRLGDAPIVLRLSWLAKQANRYIIEGSSGRLEWSIYDLDRFQWFPSGGGSPLTHVIQGAPGGFAELSVPVLEDFIGALRGDPDSGVRAGQVLPSMQLLESCYRQQTPFAMPWHDFDLEDAHVR